MRSEDRVLARKQLDKRLELVRDTDILTRPPRGWIKAIREALGMTTYQLADRIGVSQPRTVKIEKAEKDGSITLDTLERAARALDCRLVYTLVPKKPFEEMVGDRARNVAKKRLEFTGHSMALEAQAVNKEDAKDHLEQLINRLVEKSGSELWKENNDCSISRRR